MTAKRKVILVTDGDVYAAKQSNMPQAKWVAAAFPNQKGILPPAAATGACKHDASNTVMILYSSCLTIPAFKERARERQL